MGRFKPPVARTAVELDPKALEAFAGRVRDRAGRHGRRRGLGGQAARQVAGPGRGRLPALEPDRVLPPRRPRAHLLQGRRRRGRPPGALLRGPHLRSQEGQIAPGGPRGPAGPRGGPHERASSPVGHGTSAFLLIALDAVSAGPALPRPAADDMAVWKGFVAAMKTGGLPTERVRPYYEELRAPILGWLKEMSAKATWAEWDRAPEVHSRGRARPLPHTSHLRRPECELLPRPSSSRAAPGTSAISRPSTSGSTGPDRSRPRPSPTSTRRPRPISARRRAGRARSEVFNLLAELKGKEFAFDLFKDGDGYFLAARTWVPFVEPRKAFILYACWEQANLRGNTVTLEKLDDAAAVVRMSTYFFGLYKATAHLAQRIPFEDYTRIFETIWKDRARAAGWNLEIEYRNEGFRASECVLRFKRLS
ncbi:MAG: hypothetical protein M0C28_12970 [Candidatus Moduliflexus flocculans]|nr:hypothetical protein [Candidatus Moduliflexus flocculans]